MKRSLLAAILGLMTASSALAASEAAPAKADPAKAKAIVEKVCAACHGLDGNSAASANPSLAGQHAEYITKQLVEFKKGIRKNPIMAGQVATLTDEDMRNLGAYFASQQPKARGANNEKLLAEGKKIYRGGNQTSGVPACMACHGPAGAGMPIQYPRLASQHGAYVSSQLTAFKKGERANDANQMMQAIAGKMTDKEIEAVSEYISGLR
ncbi:c-type cytochrome [Parachitinimonas caeni]|uniref:C-type cytochrome n=1 Tax=Parachitinimonas caeni TaxID=3031301 RepID=A0ABT7DQY3_9NEIS|nr:c-type cytochrome [Parachitinimonas caeni]MDK2122476.1 c-type cytochrome [Parachitinimonas caeni]